MVSYHPVLWDDAIRFRSFSRICGAGDTTFVVCIGDVILRGYPSKPHRHTLDFSALRPASLTDFPTMHASCIPGCAGGDLAQLHQRIDAGDLVNSFHQRRHFYGEESREPLHRHINYSALYSGSSTNFPNRDASVSSAGAGCDVHRWPASPPRRFVALACRTR
jgi:hypothetical protein